MTKLCDTKNVAWRRPFWRPEKPGDRPLASALNHPSRANQLSVRHLQLNNIETLLFHFSGNYAA